jgi:tetratricopeptide (TPR) repeat protein
MESVERLKQQGNELFVNKDFAAAEECYSEALEICTDSDTRKILYTNRSAARLGLDLHITALEDANAAIAIDTSYMKAYYRKCTALEGLNRLGDTYYTWLEASKLCEPNETISKQLKKSKAIWLKCFRSPSQPITSPNDLAQRILLFTDKRERLSTLAYFWNDSDQDERFSYFQLLLSIIGGESELSEQSMELLTPEIMVAMPMENYIDLPKDRLQNWFDFFMTMTSQQKCDLFRTIWESLSSEEQNDIVKDMKVLFSSAALGPAAVEQVSGVEDLD